MTYGLGAGFPIIGSQVQNHWLTPRSAQPLILPRSMKWVPVIPGGFVVKNKLSPRIFFEALIYCGYSEFDK